MNIEAAGIIRIIDIEGLTKIELYEQLQVQSILLNAYAEELFADERFDPTSSKQSIVTVELSAADLGFPDGATMPELLARAHAAELHAGPLELGVYLRLHLLDQPAGDLASEVRHQAPNGSITVVSSPLTDDPDFPKGFYLRRMDGKLWLRGYRADDQHIWNGQDRFIFVKAKDPSSCL
ncbi:hypothetical protein B9G55_19560 [Saccharibacillus sp. O16]|nr:hypothetical protein B9G55_19560 [Saccharibacillus sp. O16]